MKEKRVTLVRRVQRTTGIHPCHSDCVFNVSGNCAAIDHGNGHPSWDRTNPFYCGKHGYWVVEKEDKA